MLMQSLTLYDGLVTVRRFPLIRTTKPSISAVETVTLLSIGAGAAVAGALIDLSLRIPGHAILLVVFPMTLGLSLVPRRLAGTIMGGGALMTAATMRVGGLADFSPGALTSLCLAGPLMEVALRRARAGWRLYASLVLAGLATNSAAFAVRAAAKLLLIDVGGRPFADWWPQASLTYPLCGAVAGLVSAVAFFQFSQSRAPAVAPPADS